MKEEPSEREDGWLARIHARNFSPSCNESGPISQSRRVVLPSSMFDPSLLRSSCASQSVSQSVRPLPLLRTLVVAYISRLEMAVAFLSLPQLSWD